MPLMKTLVPLWPSEDLAGIAPLQFYLGCSRHSWLLASTTLSPGKATPPPHTTYHEFNGSSRCLTVFHCTADTSDKSAAAHLNRAVAVVVGGGGASEEDQETNPGGGLLRLVPSNERHRRKIQGQIVQGSSPSKALPVFPFSPNQVQRLRGLAASVRSLASAIESPGSAPLAVPVPPWASKNVENHVGALCAQRLQDLGAGPERIEAIEVLAYAEMD
jgi:hypothetical protein